MSSEGSYKELLKKRIRRGDNSVDNDLSSDEEKWVDNFDAQMRDNSGQIDLAILTRRQLVRYVKTLNSIQEKQRIIEEYDIKNEELQQPVEVKLEYLTGASHFDPELKLYLGVEDNSECSSTSSTSPVQVNNGTTPAGPTEVEKPEQPTEMSPMKLHLIQSRTPSPNHSVSMSTYKSSSQCTSYKSSSSDEGNQTVLASQQDFPKVFPLEKGGKRSQISAIIETVHATSDNIDKSSNKEEVLISPEHSQMILRSASKQTMSENSDKESSKTESTKEDASPQHFRRVLRSSKKKLSSNSDKSSGTSFSSKEEVIASPIVSKRILRSFTKKAIPGNSDKGSSTTLSSKEEIHSPYTRSDRVLRSFAKNALPGNSDKSSISSLSSKEEIQISSMISKRSLRSSSKNNNDKGSSTTVSSKEEVLPTHTEIIIDSSKTTLSDNSNKSSGTSLSVQMISPSSNVNVTSTSPTDKENSDYSSNKSVSSQEKIQTTEEDTEIIIISSDEDEETITTSRFKRVLRSSSKYTLPQKRNKSSINSSSSNTSSKKELCSFAKSKSFENEDTTSCIKSLSSNSSYKKKLRSFSKSKSLENEDTRSCITISSSEATRSLPESQRNFYSSNSGSLDRTIPDPPSSPDADIQSSGHSQGTIHSQSPKDRFLTSLKLRLKAFRSSSKSSDNSDDKSSQQENQPSPDNSEKTLRRSPSKSIMTISSSMSLSSKENTPKTSRLRVRTRQELSRVSSAESVPKSSSSSVSSENVPLSKIRRKIRQGSKMTTDCSIVSENEYRSPTNLVSANKASFSSPENEEKSSYKSFSTKQQNDDERSHRSLIEENQSHAQDNSQSSRRVGSEFDDSVLYSYLSVNQNIPVMRQHEDQGPPTHSFSGNETFFQSTQDNYDNVPMDIDQISVHSKSSYKSVLDLTRDSPVNISDKIEPLTPDNEYPEVKLDDIPVLHLSLSGDKEEYKSSVSLLSEWSISRIPEDEQLPYFTRYLPAYEEPESFATLAPSQENEQRISLTSLIDMNDEQLFSRCLPQDDEQVLFNFEVLQNDDQMSVKSVPSLNEDIIFNAFEMFDPEDQMRCSQGFNEDEIWSNSNNSLIPSLESNKSTQSDQGMPLRSGKIKPARNENNELSVELSNLFQTLMDPTVKEKPGPVRKSTRLLERVKSPEPAYVTLFSGQRMKLRSDNVAKAARYIYKIEKAAVRRQARKNKPSLKKSMKKKKKAEKLMNEKANILNIQSTLSSTLYNFGRDCTNIFQKKKVKRRKRVLCGMKCGNVKAYTCSTTGVPICSLNCYKKNMELFNRRLIQEVVQAVHFHIVYPEEVVTGREENDEPNDSVPEVSNEE